MRIQYCSDLHLENEENNNYIIKNPLKVTGDILILAGDIVPLTDTYLSNPFLNFVENNFKMVFWVPGNHEFYHRDLNNFETSFHIKLKNNINIVHNVVLQYENIRFVFSTLWSKISSYNEKTIEQNIPDFEQILKNNKKFRAVDFNKLHDDSLNFLQKALTYNKPKTVVVTHHLPSYLSNSPSVGKSQLNEAYCVDLTDLILQSGVNFWIHGHSHFNQKPLYIGKTILLTNQLGSIQRNEFGGFRHNAYFAI